MVGASINSKYPNTAVGQKGEGHNYLTKIKTINTYELSYEHYYVHCVISGGCQAYM